MVTRAWKVYGIAGNPQGEALRDSYIYDFSEGDKVRIIEGRNSDKTGTTDYSLIIISRNTAEECEAELDGQLFDGIFENYQFGNVEEVTEW